MSKSNKTCGDCACWDSPLNNDLGLGVCRLRPPSAYPGQTSWPVTRRQERCIEGYRPKLLGVDTKVVD